MNKQNYEKTPIGQAKKEAQIVAGKYPGQLVELRKAFGTRPWDDPKLNQNESLAAYAAVRDDPDFWHRAVLLEGRKLNLTDGLLPRNLIEDTGKMETRYLKALSDGTLPTDVPDVGAQ